MNTDIQIFENSEFGQIRTSGTSNNPTFCLKDLCAALGIENSRDCKSRLNPDGVGSTDIIDRMGRKQSAIFVDEGNMYMCVFMSRKPNARAFQRWVTTEVLPAIRKTGSYSLATPSYQIEDPIKRAERWIEEEKKRQRLEAENVQKQKLLDEQQPKVDFADTISASKGSIPINDFAKIIAKNGIKMGVNRLYCYLRNEDYLGSHGKYRNRPYSQYIDNGYFEMEENEFEKWVNVSTYITPKGQGAILKKILKDKRDGTLESKIR